MKWKESFRICSNDVDAFGNIKPGAIMRYMQETAYLHMEGIHPSANELRTQGKAFLLARASLSIYGNLSHRDEIDVETWESERKGVGFGRCFSVSCGGVTVAEMASVWTLYNFAERKIIRVSDADNIVYGSDEELALDLPRRLIYPDADELVLIGTHTASFSDTDKNKHINNTVYADILSDFVPEIRTGDARIVSFYINYANECRMDDEIRIYRTGETNEWYFRTLRSDGRINVEVKIITE